MRAPNTAKIGISLFVLFVCSIGQVQRKRQQSKTPQNHHRIGIERKEEETTESKGFKCPLTSRISCERVDNGEACTRETSKHGKHSPCETIEGLFHFSYCNLNQKGSMRQHRELFTGEIQVNHENRSDPSKEPIHDINLRGETCRTIARVMQLDTCSDSFEASLEMEAWSNGDIVCSSHSTFRILQPISTLVQ